MLRKFIFQYNNIDFQDLKTAYELSYTAWNNIINQLREQTNNSTTYIETLNTWLFGSSDAPYEYTEDLGDYNSFYDYIQEFIHKIQSSVKELKSTKVNSVAHPTMVYATDEYGKQTTVSYSVNPKPNAIPKTDEGARLKVGNPVEGSDAVNLLTANKKYVGKSDKKGTVYSVDENGVQNNISFSVNPNANNIVQRDVSGGIKINEILQDDHATSKKYVDNKIKNNVGIYGAPNDFPVVGEIGKFYISTYNESMYYWNGSNYKEISSSGSDDFDLIDGGDAEEYDVAYDIFDGGGA